MKQNSSMIVLLCLLLQVFFDAPCASASMESLIPAESPVGWNMKSTPEVFTPDTLFEHINGQADLFLQYGFVASVFTTYVDNSYENKIDVDIYDMDNVLNAFGIFSRFRQEDNPAGVGLDSFIEDNSAFFYQGRYFVVMQSVDPNASALKKFAELLSIGLRDASAPPREISWFPQMNLKPGSMEYYPNGLMGRNYFNKGFKTEYVVKEDTTQIGESNNQNPTLFLSIFDDSQQSESSLHSFREDLAKKSGNPESDKILENSCIKGKDPYQGFMIVARKDNYLVGAAGFPNETIAKKLLSELIGQLP